MWTTMMNLYSGVPGGQYDRPYFETKPECDAWMERFISFRGVNYSYLDAQNRDVIKVINDADAIKSAEYVGFKNDDFGLSQWVYCKIREVKWQNPECSYIYFDVDPWLTYAGQWRMIENYVERENPRGDYTGTLNKLYTRAEHGEVGNYKRTTVLDYQSANGYFYTVYMVPNVWVGAQPVIHQGVYTGLLRQQFESPGEAAAFINNAVGAQVGDAIVGITQMPRNMALLGEGVPMTTGGPSWDFDGYEAQNTKMLCYPYQFLEAVTSDGQRKIYKYEQFINPESTGFQMCATNGLFTELAAVPLFYQDEGLNFGERLTFNNFPKIIWSSDAWSSLLSKIPGLAIQAGAAYATGGLSAAVGLGVSGLDAAINSLSGQASGSSSGEGYLNALMNMQGIKISRCQLVKDVAESTDKTFSAFGYQVDRTKVPELNSRPFWNYVKLRDAMLIARFPYAHVNEIQEIFNHGVRLWKDGEDIGNFNRDNRG